MKETIKSTDVRIGNYYDHNGEYRRITPSVLLDIWDAPRNWVKPIPLSEELLLNNCGFRLADIEDKFGGYISPELPNGNKIRLKKENDIFVWNTQHVVVKLEFLHEMQNFFKIFGQELTVNL